MKPASSSTQQRARPRPFGLTAEQTALYDSVVPHVIDRAVDALLHRYDAWGRGDDLRQEGVLAIGVGIPTFDPARGMRFPQWAFWTATFAMVQILRAERRHRRGAAAVRKARALHDAYEAATGDLLRGVIDLAGAEATPGARRVAGRALARLAAEPPVLDGEDGVVLREDQARIVEVLGRLVSELRPEQRVLLRRGLGCEGPTLKEAAQRLGATRGYRAELRAYHAVIALLGARLAGAGFDTLVAWPAEEIGTILGEDEGDDAAGPPSRSAA